jgi:Na+/H+ antiporter NhaD/arsenite permease-like protein
MMNLNNENATLTISTNSLTPVPLSVSVDLVSSLVDMDVILGAIVLVVMYILIIFEVAHRTVVSMMSATAAIAVLAVLDERPSLEEIVSWIDIETVVLLFAMMIMVSILSETGVFNFLGYWSFKVTKGKVWPLLTLLCFLTATISAVLDNVTTILLMTPVVIKLSEAVSVDPVKVLIANVIFSNIGGAATAIGDPPNVLIANDPAIQAAGVNFGTFTLHMIFAVLVVAVVAFAQLRLMYRKLTVNHDDKELTDLRHEIMIWHRSAQSLPNMSREEAMVRSSIEVKIKELREELEAKELALHQRQPQRSYQTSIEEMEANCQITDKPLLVKSICVLTVTIALFFMQNFPQFQLSLGWTALLGALTLLVLSDKLEVESVFSRVEWSTLVFFASLFVVMEALNKLNLLNWIGNGVESIIESVPPGYQLTVSIVLILWVSGIASAFIDNIPFTTMMIPIIVRLSESTTLDLPLQPLVWSLALGACLGGNGTLIGASANVVCAGVAEQHGYKFTFKDFFVVGMPITIVSLVVANIYLLICHVAFEWH